jgi:hypothetical protein
MVNPETLLQDCWPLLLIIASGCGLGRTPLHSLTSVGGALSDDGTAGQVVGGNAGGTDVTAGTVGFGGFAETVGLLGFGGNEGTGGVAGLIDSGGASHTGGVGEMGGIGGTGGMVPATGGTGGASGTTGSSPVFGISCTTNDDCPSGSTCCNGSNESCDGTLPTGEGTDSGEFIVSADGNMVTDTVTGLVWQRSAPSATYTQAEAEAYCGTLSLGGFSDWRVPAAHELQTIVDLANYDPAIDPSRDRWCVNSPTVRW